jgi:hypothetical protein
MHMVMWLVGSLTSKKMEAALHTDPFHAKVKEYIKTNIRADLDGTDKVAVNNMGRKSGLSYSRPIDSREGGYRRHAHTFEMQLAKAVQHHKC